MSEEHSIQTMKSGIGWSGDAFCDYNSEQVTE